MTDAERKAATSRMAADLQRSLRVDPSIPDKPGSPEVSVRP